MSKGRVFKCIFGWISSCLFFESFIAIGIICTLPYVATAAFPVFDFDDDRCADTRIDLVSTLPDGMSELGDSWDRDKYYSESATSKGRRSSGGDRQCARVSSGRKMSDISPIPPLISDQISAVLQKTGLVASGKKYHLQNVPGDGLCGCWALLVAASAANGVSDGRVDRAQVSVLLDWLADDLTKFLAQSKFTEEELRIYDELMLLIAQYTDAAFDNIQATDRCRFLSMLKDGRIQLDSVLTRRLTKYFQRTIIVIYDNRNAHIYNYPGDLSPLIIFYQGNGSSGHYWSTIPEEYTVKKEYDHGEQSPVMLLKKSKNENLS